MVRVSSGAESKQDYGTPQYLFDYFNSIFKYSIDVAASAKNAKCNRFYTEKDDGLQQSWKGERVWCNPPYNDVVSWINKAIGEIWSNDCQSVSLLLNHDNGSKWYRTLYLNNALKHVYLIGHRIRFEGAKHSQAVPSAVFYLDHPCHYNKRLCADRYVLVDPPRK